MTRQRRRRVAATTCRSARASLLTTNLLPPVHEGWRGVPAAARGSPEGACGLPGGDLARGERAGLNAAPSWSGSRFSSLVSEGPSLQAGPARGSLCQ
eukprot:9910478-Heterocapsa_arctica.AAC.1